MKIDVPRELLYEEYVVKEKPMHLIASEQGLSVGLIYNRIKEYGISSRHHLTDKAKHKISCANKGRVSSRLGKHLTKEARIAIGRAHRGKYKRITEFGGHKKKRQDGYIEVYSPDHPNASKNGYVMEHKLVMEKHIGRRLERDEVVHHINHVRDDNRINNLQLMTFKEHASLHMRERWQKKKGEMTYQ